MARRSLWTQTGYYNLFTHQHSDLSLYSNATGAQKTTRDTIFNPLRAYTVGSPVWDGLMAEKKTSAFTAGNMEKETNVNWLADRT